ncbi:2-keto-3-deoxy-galactonokinase [Oceaniovalibus guishaninsula JLT2003]|uniref:2-keto-3-deoxy-galactonokinase n=1 Tax=Oceaniovalibus guishaninsula JLT2003 TaxID=1231392 RepID=K2GMK8_9RHOB|nr:2-dehydro-3-deoxygalactonokinase [Oceaniovalibus guishaninsula]EKE43966.1 2-keto-3-deoxy-galactonokinase [Oceaniovalibus guishaninsula JLT2003]
MTAPDWIAVDWGTTRLRAWAMRGTDPLAEARAETGMNAIPPGGFEAALLDLVGGWSLAPATPVIACGMVGARQGWVEAPYRPVPCPPLGGVPVAAHCDDPRLNVRIVPGLSQSAPPDVMRGEETQIAGFLSLNPDFDGVVCLPGSHCKWVHVSAGEVVSFQTAMTGELFAALSRHTVLRHSIGDGWDDDAFGDAVSTALSRPERLATGLFGLRAEGLLDGLAPASATARLSGLLIGMELAATRAYWLGRAVALIGAPDLCRHYAAALQAQGVTPMLTRADTTTLAGLAAARRTVAP